jgi:uncharacterized protein with HEPN domain
MRGLRNRVIHDYAHIDVAILWETAANDLPATRQSLMDLLNHERPDATSQPEAGR